MVVEASTTWGWYEATKERGEGVWQVGVAGWACPTIELIVIIGLMIGGNPHLSRLMETQQLWSETKMARMVGVVFETTMVTVEVGLALEEGVESGTTNIPQQKTERSHD